MTEDIEGFKAIDLPNGTRYIACHYTADPGKRGDWAAQFTQVPRREWDREMEGREDVWDGEPVYAEYRDAWHSPAAFRDKEIPLFRDAIYLGGWDCGATLQPAFVLVQLLPPPEWQVHVIAELAPEAGFSMDDFAPMVSRLLEKRLPGQFEDVRHIADATVVQRSGANGLSAQMVAKSHGFSLRPGSNAKGPRISGVTKLLMDRLDERVPRFIVDGKSCPVLREGFQGAYKFEVSKRGDELGQGRILQDPLKNGWSHVHDALQYACEDVHRIVNSYHSHVERRNWTP